MKDNFSGHSKQYSQFRPGYPIAFYEFLLPLVNKKERARDCVTGNGHWHLNYQNISTRCMQHFITVYRYYPYPCIHPSKADKITSWV